MNHPLHAQNRLAWNQAANAYRKELSQTVAFLRAGGVSMCPPELSFLQNLSTWCETAIHLQCAAGEDTLSLLTLGAQRVVGIDISENMIQLARETSTQLNANASWVCCDILEVPVSLHHSADLVYTGRGAINWIHDLERWAHTVVSLLKPGGTFYLYEGHPVTYFFDVQAENLCLDPEWDGYFAKKTYTSTEWTAEYVGDLNIPDGARAEKHERAWPVSEVMTALLTQGLCLSRFEEHPDAYWNEFPHLPEKERRRIPNTYSLLMHKEAR